MRRDVMNQAPEPLDEPRPHDPEAAVRRDPELDDPFEATAHDGSREGIWSATGMEPTGHAPWPGEGGPHREAFHLGFLQPSARAGSLGKIGNYEVLEILGRGGMGVVLKAFDPPLHRAVAIKMMDPKLALSRRSRKRFLREARSAAAINHANVVTIHAVGMQGGMPYLVMEFIPGLSLRQRIRNGPMAIPDIVRIGLQVARGLAAAHEQGVIHRDIKPANIMLEAGVDRVKITDFGLALAAMNLSEMTSEDQVVGTPAYMSPEQVLTAPIDPRSDLFSLGCVIYAMAAGSSPFKGAHTLEVIRKVAEVPHTPLRDVRPDAPPALCALVDRLLSKDPNGRPRSAGDVAEILQKSPLESSLCPSESRNPARIDPRDEPAPAAPSRKSRHTWGWDRAWMTVASVALAVVAVGGLGKWFSDPPQPPPATPAPRSPWELRVGESAESDFPTIARALAAARPGTTIRVAPGLYREALAIEGPGGGRDLTIDAPGAILTAPPEADAVLRLDAAPGIVVRGLTLRRSSPAQLALSMAGPGDGATLENVRVESPPDDAGGQTILLKDVLGTSSSPVVLRGLIVQGAGLGLGLYGTGETPTAWVVVEDCRFTGPGVHVLMHGNFRHVKIRENVFVGGVNGVNLDFFGETTSDNEVAGNTFLNCTFWVGLVHTTPRAGQVVLFNNAILGSERVEWSAPDGPLLASRAWTFRSNWWEPSSETDTDAGLDGAIAEIRPDLRILSLDPNDPDFLRPAENSPLAAGGAGGASHRYAGAVPPYSRLEDPGADASPLPSHDREKR